MARDPRRSAGGFRALVFSVLVHLLAIGLLAISVKWTWDLNQATPGVIDAVVVDDAKMKAEAERLREEAQRRDRAEEQARQAAQEAERQHQAEEQRRVEAQRREQEEAKRKLVEAERKKAAEAEKVRIAEAEKKKEQERKKKQQEQQRKEAEEALRDQLAAEERQREAAAQQQKVAQQQRDDQARQRSLEEARGNYIGLIKQKVTQNWIRPVGVRKGMQCAVRVRVTPGGQVIAATVTRSSGNPAFDRSAESAVYKATPLPVPTEKDLFEAHFREFDFVFNPED